MSVRILHKRPKGFRRDPLAWIWVRDEIPIPVYDNTRRARLRFAAWLKLRRRRSTGKQHVWIVFDSIEEMADIVLEYLWEEHEGDDLATACDPGWLSRQRRGARQARREMERLSPK